MGITGLLPSLKSIQVTKHLSEFAGQTLAVDAYVWLHRGVLACATELATGKKTHKYVDYAMHRVRLLRHHNIEPYIVFDGGPLPAKKGTEVDRKKKREEGLSRGNALAAQGKHSQAREYYVKCVDVTPQMAFQFIKALKAESVQYVVAPYEADAQLAYLERIGVVNGIITEDSDLLVFGCQNVLFKLDAVASTVVSIMRKDFASVTASSTDSNGISLVGWSDVQFRAMAILSGCDYLPSIPGIGLKTACSLLRKWKTVEQVLRAITLEGKKSVPKGYLKQYRLAEKCFLHQRVYCPREGRLVHLTEVDEGWNDETEKYAGSDLESTLAQGIAIGDVDPVTLLPMKDINPGFMPRPHKLHPLISVETNRQDKGKGKAKGTPIKEGILSFFGPNPAIPQRKREHSHPIITRTGLAGKASGKRTLTEILDQDASKKNRRSKFFTSSASPKHKITSRSAGPGDGCSISAPGPSHQREEKENVYIVIDDDDEPSLGAEADSNVSMETQGEVDTEMAMDLDDPSLDDAVEQEDGYISPTLSCSRDTQELSSPPRPNHTPDRKHDLYFGVDAVSSPPSPVNDRRHRSRPPSKHRPIRSHSWPHMQMQTQASNTSVRCAQPKVSSASFSGPDLQNIFVDDLASEVEGYQDETKDASGSNSPPTPCPSPPMPITPDDGQAAFAINDDVMWDLADLDAQANEARKKAVVTGWRERWALNGMAERRGYGASKLMRRETNVTPAGRHQRLRPYPAGGPHSTKPKRTQTRRSLPFLKMDSSDGSQPI